MLGPILLLALFSPLASIDVGISIKLWHILALLILMYRISNGKRYEIELLYIPSVFMISNIFSSLGYGLNISLFGIAHWIFGPVQIFFALIVAKETSKEGVDCFLKLFIFINVFSGLIGLVTLPSNIAPNTTHFGVFVQHSFPRLSGFVGDPNIFALYSVLVFIYCAINRQRLFCIFLAAMIFWSQSRTGIVVFLASISGLMFFNSTKNFVARFFVALVVIFIFGGLLYLFNNLIGINRFESISQLGGRLQIWNFAIDQFFVKPVLGHGVGSARELTMSFFGTPTYLHNTLLEVLVERGVLGTGLLVIMLMLSLDIHRQRVGYTVLLLVVIFVSSLSLSILYNEVVWWFLGLTVLKIGRKCDIHSKYT